MKSNKIYKLLAGILLFSLTPKLDAMFAGSAASRFAAARLKGFTPSQVVGSTASQEPAVKLESLQLRQFRPLGRTIRTQEMNEQKAQGVEEPLSFLRGFKPLQYRASDEQREALQQARQGMLTELPLTDVPSVQPILPVQIPEIGSERVEPGSRIEAALEQNIYEPYTDITPATETELRLQDNVSYEPEAMIENREKALKMKANELRQLRTELREREKPVVGLAHRWQESNALRLLQGRSTKAQEVDDLKRKIAELEADVEVVNKLTERDVYLEQLPAQLERDLQQEINSTKETMKAIVRNNKLSTSDIHVALTQELEAHNKRFEALFMHYKETDPITKSYVTDAWEHINGSAQMEELHAIAEGEKPLTELVPASITPPKAATATFSSPSATPLPSISRRGYATNVAQPVTSLSLAPLAQTPARQFVTRVPKGGLLPSIPLSVRAVIQRREFERLRRAGIPKGELRKVPRAADYAAINENMLDFMRGKQLPFVPSVRVPAHATRALVPVKAQQEISAPALRPQSQEIVPARQASAPATQTQALQMPTSAQVSQLLTVLRRTGRERSQFVPHVHTPSTSTKPLVPIEQPSQAIEPVESSVALIEPQPEGSTRVQMYRPILDILARSTNHGSQQIKDVMTFGAIDSRALQRMQLGELQPSAVVTYTPQLEQTAAPLGEQHAYAGTLEVRTPDEVLSTIDLSRLQEADIPQHVQTILQQVAKNKDVTTIAMFSPRISIDQSSMAQLFESLDEAFTNPTLFGVVARFQPSDSTVSRVPALSQNVSPASSVAGAVSIPQVTRTVSGLQPGNTSVIYSANVQPKELQLRPLVSVNQQTPPIRIMPQGDNESVSLSPGESLSRQLARSREADRLQAQIQNDDQKLLVISLLFKQHKYAILEAIRNGWLIRDDIIADFDSYTNKHGYKFAITYMLKSYNRILKHVWDIQSYIGEAKDSAVATLEKAKGYIRQAIRLRTLVPSA